MRNPSEGGVLGLGSRVSDFRFQVSCLGSQVPRFGSQVSGICVWVLGFEFLVSGFGLRDSGICFRSSGFGIRDSGFGYQGSGIKRGGGEHLFKLNLEKAERLGEAVLHVQRLQHLQGYLAHKKTAETFVLKMAQAKAVIWP